MLYSKSTNGFYIKEIHGENIPFDVIEIDDNLYQQLIDGQSNGKVISTDTTGKPILVDMTNSNDSFLLNQCKKQAKKLLKYTDYSQLGDVSNDIKNIEEFVSFRKKIRQLMLNPVKNPEFPEIPTPVWNNKTMEK